MIKDRKDILNALKGSNNVGIELGVAGGRYSKQMVESNKFSKVYGVDIYQDHHDTKQYLSTLSYIGLDNPYTLIRSSFEEALILFPDNFFDYIYIDGYAHTGQEEGKTLYNWFSKLKENGIFAGHDYHSKWPKTVKAVDEFVKFYNLNLNLTNEQTPLYPSWYTFKE
jgi:ubiquinone/menaquinone biosynthesis C-methylase UbiE